MKHNYFSFLILILLSISTTSIYAQTVITGIIKSAEGTPVPFASVKIRGTNLNVRADTLGNFKINTNVPIPFYLQVSSVGYKPQDFQILKLQDTPIELVLVEDALLDQIVVTSRRDRKSVV